MRLKITCRHNVHLLSFSLTGHARSQIRADYAQKVLGGVQKHDPFKLALLKILGRCDLQRKTIPEVIQTTEDYLWLQLWLVREGVVLPEESSYTLADLQQIVRDFGPSVFDPKNNNPLRYFFALLLVGLFEEAIVCLYQSPFQLDVVHFAVAMAYYGALRVVDDPELSPGVVSAEDTKLNYAKMLSQFHRSLAEIDAVESFHYLFLITMVESPKHLSFCHSLVRDAVLNSGDFGTLLGMCGMTELLFLGF